MMTDTNYNSLYVTLAGTPRRRLADFVFAARVECTLAEGWTLWRRNPRGPDIQIAGEFNHDGMRLDINGVVIMDSLTELEAGSVIEQLNTARGLALHLFAGKLDRGGWPYIDHVMRVADAMANPIDATIAWLHDVVEDTSTTLDDLREAFSDEVVDAVDALTRREGEDYLGVYIPRAARNARARRVKLADLADNKDFNRLKKITREDVQRWLKYDSAEQYVRTIEAQEV